MVHHRISIRDGFDFINGFMLMSAPVYKISYDKFLANKVQAAGIHGFIPKSPPHESLKEHQRDIAHWMCVGGQRACFTAFGTGKTRIHLQVAKWCVENEPGKKYLFVTPLGVRQEFISNDGPQLGMELVYCKTNGEVDACESPFIITNYERVRDGGISPDERFCGAGLDESSILRSFGSKTYQTFLTLFKRVKYRYVFTATPSPNKYKELIHYGGFLGVMDTGEALTRWFKRNSTQANDLTLYPHSEEKFWLWLSTWAVFMQKPSDLGYSDDGYDLPSMNVHWHCVAVDHKKAWKMIDSWGQHQLFLDKSSGLRELAEVKRETMAIRLGKAQEIMAESPSEHFIIWHELELERHLITKAIEDVKCVYGSQDLEEREERIMAFQRGEIKNLGTKPILSGSGCNLQHHCHNAIFLGSTFKFNDFIQAVHRIYRFLQKFEVNIHIIYSESEEQVIKTLKKKWKQHDELVEKMSALLRKFKLSIKPDMNLKKSVGCDRLEVECDLFRAIHNDCVEEVATWPDNCVDEIVTSIPFGNQYEYTPSVNDFGHNPNNQAFFRQMDFLVPHLLRVLKPGRVACIHVKDRIRFGNVTGLGMPTVDRFSDKTADCFEKHGFAFMGKITIDTDVVRENNQTYRLGWTENSKDSTKMGVGMPEYVLLMRKLPSDLSNAYADTPVHKDKDTYTRAQWQIDAASLWRSNGDRLPDPEFLVNIPMDAIGRIWREHCRKKGYDYNEHVKIGKDLEKKGKLPSSFMLFPPVSLHPEIWTDITRMRVLNAKQSQKGAEHHVCPLQLDIVDRLIERYTNKGEIVYDPFGGIGTVPYCAIKLGRVGWMTELSPEYWRNAVGYCEQAEAERTAPTLFDMSEMEVEVINK